MSRYRLRYNGEQIEIPGTDFLVGRAPECHVQLSGGLVSRNHARVREGVDGLVVEELGSRNGVLVNQRKIRGPTLLAHGDVIGIGMESFELVDTYVLQHPAHLSTMAPPPVPPGEADVDGANQITVAATLDILTAREREVLELIVLGHTQREMSERLHISVKTIESHRAKLAEKLRCETRADLVSYAISAGMLRGR